MTTINVLDHGYVRYVTHWGDDLSPLEAARMSTGNPTGVDEAKDDRLRERLWQDKHATPFEMAGLHLEWQAPIFVARQVFRHRQFSYNEHSGRYAEMPDLFYIPHQWRAQSVSNKQASGEVLAKDWAPEVEALCGTARALYHQMLGQGVSREMARMVLPVNQYTRWRMSGNLRAWAHFLSLRLPADVQPETRAYAEAVAAIVGDVFPKTWGVMQESVNVSEAR